MSKVVNILWTWSKLIMLLKSLLLRSNSKNLKLLIEKIKLAIMPPKFLWLLKYKARERYSFGVSDYRGIFGVEGA